MDAVSKKNPTIDFFTDWENALLVGGVATYFAGRLFNQGQSFPWLSKMGGAFASYWAFSRVASVVDTTGSTVSEISAVYSSTENENVREKNDAVWRNTSQLKNRQTWMAYKGLASALKVASSLFVIYEVLHAIGARESGLSARMKVGGVVAGILGTGMDVVDLRIRWQDAEKDKIYKTATKDWGVSDARKAYKLNLQYEAARKVIDLATKMIAFATALYVIKKPALLGRVVKHSDAITNAFLLGLSGTLFWKHVSFGCQKENSIKAAKGTVGIKEYFYKTFFNSPDFVRLVGGGLNALVDAGYESCEFLGKTSLAPIATLAKGVSEFRSFSKTVERFDSCLVKGRKAASLKKRELYEAGLATLKFSADFFAVLKFVGSFGGVAYLSSRVKGFGYIKSGLKLTASVATLVEEIFCPKEPWESKKKNKALAVATITSSLFSIFLNGYVGLLEPRFANATESSIKPFTPAVKHTARLGSTLNGLAITLLKETNWR